jgi:uncharacterized protein YegP (UPF0339 family)
MRFKIFKYKSGQWGFHLIAANNEIVTQGEGYHNKADLLGAINLIKQSVDAPVEEEDVKKK